MARKDVTTFSQWLQCIMLCIQQYSMHIFYKPGPELYIVDRLSYNNHAENRDQEIIGMNVTMHALNTVVDIPTCTSMDNI